MQSGLCDIVISSEDITAPLLLSTHARPSKRPFADMDDDAGEEPNSDELYGWIEDDEVAAEGLLINETPTIDDVATLGHGIDLVADSRNKKVLRTSTISF